MGQKILRFLAGILRYWAPQLIAYLLKSVRPTILADQLRPYLSAMMREWDPEYRALFAAGIRKLAAIVDALAEPG